MAGRNLRLELARPDAAQLGVELDALAELGHALGPLAVVDLETTGATAHVDRITEIGIVEVDCGHYIGEWSSLVNPQQIGRAHV